VQKDKITTTNGREYAAYSLLSIREAGVYGSFYEKFEPEEAGKLCKKFEFHYTPKKASWLNIAEIEFSALSSV